MIGSSIMAGNMAEGATAGQDGHAGQIGRGLMQLGNPPGAVVLNFGGGGGGGGAEAQPAINAGVNNNNVEKTLPRGRMD